MAQERTYYLAVDIGASSGRHMLGWMQDGKLRLEEVYRFPNGATEQNGALVWDGEGLCRQSFGLPRNREDPFLYGHRHLGRGLRAFGRSGGSDRVADGLS